MNTSLFSLKIPGLFGAKRNLCGNSTVIENASGKHLKVEHCKMHALYVPKGQYETSSVWQTCLHSLLHIAHSQFFSLYKPLLLLNSWESAVSGKGGCFVTLD